MLKAIYRSPSLRATAAFGIGGVAFTVGNLVLAGVLSSNEFGLLSLFLAIIAVAGPSSPLGLNHVVTRRGLPLVASLRRTTLITCLLSASATALFCAALYHLDLTLLISVFVATVSMGLAQTVNAHFQGQRQYGLAIPFTQISNWALAPIGVAAWAWSLKSADLPAEILAASTLVAAVIGWTMVARRTSTEVSTQPPVRLFGEAMSLLSINVAGSILLQLERLVIPMTIGIGKLALFGVAASLVGSPFRMLQMAVNFTVIPRMRVAGSAVERRQLLYRELLLIAVVMGPASVLLWLIAPVLAHWFFGGRYDLDTVVIVAMIVSGLLKVLSASATAVVSALAPDRGLWLLSATTWACIALSVLLAFSFRPWGLAGAIYAVSVGWVINTVVAFWISLPYLRH